jgi:hypothetical protein
MPEEGRELARLFKAVMALYTRDTALSGVPVMVFTGSRVINYLEPRSFAGKPASQETFVSNVCGWAKAAGASCLDVSEYLKKQEGFGALYFWKNDWHPTPMGHVWLAEGLTDALVRRHVLQEEAKAHAE